MAEPIGLICDACGQYIEFDVPVTFWSPPLCDECEASLTGPANEGVPDVR